MVTEKQKQFDTMVNFAINFFKEMKIKNTEIKDDFEREKFIGEVLLFMVQH
jgi:hypothetical protein